MPRYTDRRTVLKTTGGLFVMTAGIGQAVADEIKPLNLDVKQEALNREKRGVIPTRVTGSQQIADHADFPGLVYFGHFDQFIKDGNTLFLPESPETVLATPTKTQSVEDGDGSTFTNDMLYDTQNVDFSRVSDEDDSTELGIGFFPNGGPSKESHWDTDEVSTPGQEWDAGNVDETAGWYDAGKNER